MEIENFFVDDKFYADMDSLMNDLDLETEQDVLELATEYQIGCTESALEPLVKITYDWIVDRVNEHRFPEDNDRVCNEFRTAIESIDFDKVNSLMPELYYPTRKKFVLTKNDFLEYIK